MTDNSTFFARLCLAAWRAARPTSGMQRAVKATMTIAHAWLLPASTYLKTSCPCFTQTRSRFEIKPYARLLVGACVRIPYLFATPASPSVLVPYALTFALLPTTKPG